MEEGEDEVDVRECVMRDEWGDGASRQCSEIAEEGEDEEGE